MTGHHVLHPFGFDTFGLPANSTRSTPASTPPSRCGRTRPSCGASCGGSGWPRYYLRYLDPIYDTALADPRMERYWMSPSGVDLYVGGVEHAVLHLLYARFWHKVLYDRGVTSTPEPFGRLVNQGYILADAYTDTRGQYVPAAEVTRSPDGWEHHGQPVTRRSGKMGKSLKNGISPDDIYAAYGADTLRLYEMAMGPLDGDRPWRTDDITGMHRFLQRLWRLIVDESTGETRIAPNPSQPSPPRPPPTPRPLPPLSHLRSRWTRPPRSCCTGPSP